MMEGRRFGIGLAAGILLALAIVTVSGGLGSSISGTFAPAGAATSASTTTVASARVTMSTTTIPQTATFSVTSTVSIATTTNAGSVNSSVTYASSPATTSSTTVTGTTSSVPSTTITSTINSLSSTTSTYNPGSFAAVTNATSATNGTPYNFFMPSETNKPSLLANVVQQPIASKVEILAPVLAAFLLGAFLYRVATRERERSDGT